MLRSKLYNFYHPGCARSIFGLQKRRKYRVTSLNAAPGKRTASIFRANTTIPIAEVISYAFSQTLIDRDYLLMIALPGTPLSDVLGMTRTEFDRALHQVANIFSSFTNWNKLIDDVAACGLYTPDEARAMRNLLNSTGEHFDRPVDRACCIWTCVVRIF